MATVTLKNVPDELYDQIRQSVKTNRRSINSEIIVCIEQAFGGCKVDPKKILLLPAPCAKKPPGICLQKKKSQKSKMPVAYDRSRYQ